MKTVIIGDVHGHDTWKEIVNREGLEDRRYIFVGDYWDSFTVPFNTQAENFLDIVQFKNYNSENVTLLAGNHDFNNYVYGNPCSGIQDTYAPQIREMLYKNKKLFDVCTIIVNEFAEGPYLVSHAGFTKQWCNRVSLEYSDINQFVKEVNNLYQSSNPSPFFFYTGPFDYYGDDARQGPMWIRPNTLIGHMIGYDQIVGHTPQDEINILVNESAKKVVYLVDSYKDYLTIDTNNNIEIIKLDE